MAQCSLCGAVLHIDDAIAHTLSHSRGEIAVPAKGEKWVPTKSVASAEIVQ